MTLTKSHFERNILRQKIERDVREGRVTARRRGVRHRRVEEQSRGVPKTPRHAPGRRLGGRPELHQAHQLRRARADEPHARVPAAAHRAVFDRHPPHPPHHLPLPPRRVRVQQEGPPGRELASDGQRVGVRGDSRRVRRDARVRSAAEEIPRGIASRVGGGGTPAVGIHRRVPGDDKAGPRGRSQAQLRRRREPQRRHCAPEEPQCDSGGGSFAS